VKACRRRLFPKIIDVRQLFWYDKVKIKIGRAKGSYGKTKW
jgi:hypothetical protein